MVEQFTVDGLSTVAASSIAPSSSSYQVFLSVGAFVGVGGTRESGGVGGGKGPAHHLPCAVCSASPSTSRCRVTRRRTSPFAFTRPAPRRAELEVSDDAHTPFKLSGLCFASQPVGLGAGGRFRRPPPTSTRYALPNPNSSFGDAALGRVMLRADNDLARDSGVVCLFFFVVVLQRFLSVNEKLSIKETANAWALLYVGIYAAIGLTTAFVGICSSTAQMTGALRASRKLFRAPCNRGPRHIQRRIPCVFLFPATFISLFYYTFAIGHLNTRCHLRRMESNSRSPIFSDFGELLQGIVTVRAFSAEKRFLDNLHTRIDLTTKMWYPFWMTNRWLLLNFNFLGSLVSRFQYLMIHRATCIASSVFFMSMFSIHFLVDDAARLEKLADTDGWPALVDFKDIVNRTLSLKDELADIILCDYDLYNCVTWDNFLESIDYKIHEFGALMEPYGHEEAVLRATCEYLGPQGVFLIHSTIRRIFRHTLLSLRRVLTKTIQHLIDQRPRDFDSPNPDPDVRPWHILPIESFIEIVLVPHVATCLISQDMGVS
ncbi:hypothetical protein MVEN_02546500 [Mycena venus]|uniref:ABC transmembrane type-1 domain-containing protein n=1 Tax=Mycena venus TaxID=2733690 RepID=A0A8H6WUF5_9AGAR|nr:hypothetical protein MVEN_02546500 [Mycena venus]